MAVTSDGVSFEAVSSVGFSSAEGGVSVGGAGASGTTGRLGAVFALKCEYRNAPSNTTAPAPPRMASCRGFDFPRERRLGDSSSSAGGFAFDGLLRVMATRNPNVPLQTFVAESQGLLRRRQHRRLRNQHSRTLSGQRARRQKLRSKRPSSEGGDELFSAHRRLRATAVFEVWPEGGMPSINCWQVF